MKSLLPTIKVNYSLGELLSCLLIPLSPKDYFRELRRDFKDLFGVNDVVFVSSCREAIRIILLSLEQKKVIIPAYTCDVVVKAAAMAGKQIVFAPVSKETLNIDTYPPIDADTILIATHQYGYPCEIDAIVQECHKKGAIVIEDCAGAIGAKYKNQYVGTFGDYGVFSFNSSKTITAPSGGGAIIAKNLKTIQYLIGKYNEVSYIDSIRKWIKSAGLVFNNNSFFHSLFHRFVINNTQPTIGNEEDIKNLDDFSHSFYEWQAYITHLQFQKWNKIIQKRKELYNSYISGLNTPVVHVIDGAECLCNRYVTFVKNRESFIEYCSAHGIGVGRGFERVICPKSFSEGRLMAEEIVYLPFSSRYAKDEIVHIISTVNEAYEKTNK